MTKQLSIVSPIDGSVVAERPIATVRQQEQCLQAARDAQQAWRNTPIAQKAALCHLAIDQLLSKHEVITEEITRQMGRPIQYTPGELRGLEERGRYMVDIAASALADSPIQPSNPKLTRFIRRAPLGLVVIIAPWNYPYLTAVNAIIPALMAGNTVILKHSAQTLLCAERFQQAFDQAGLPPGVFQHLHLDHAGTTQLITHEAVDFISFTGSVAGGHTLEKSVAGLFKGLALELGGKDPAYVRQDAVLEHTVPNLVDGAFFNSGQSCCAVERIYVHEQRYDEFVESFVAAVNQYQLGNPLDPHTTLGPLVNANAALRVKQHIDQACAAGATPCIDSQRFALDSIGPAADKTLYLAPQVLLNVDHSMAVMREESFGPVVGIMKVRDDEHAVQLMNDSRYGLTASLWSQDAYRAQHLGDAINTGTVLMNRCDYLDPALAWVGVKQSGRGCALSSLGYQQLTRPKSFYINNEY